MRLSTSLFSSALVLLQFSLLPIVVAAPTPTESYSSSIELPSSTSTGLLSVDPTATADFAATLHRLDALFLRVDGEEDES
ncbi:hypothetical protein D9756_006261 [Leucocoprinus leucothites]|uniref:Uncharacterized protein n=1 Tax=Leucocoprinus leucothites TaxID=201217 RepID=A0A8H5D2V5_9AGAR|nr:hypothetical protein D9756_006261 [Leucoagaricus leucothites]